MECCRTKHVVFMGFIMRPEITSNDNKQIPQVVRSLDATLAQKKQQGLVPAVHSRVSKYKVLQLQDPGNSKRVRVCGRYGRSMTLHDVDSYNGHFLAPSAACQGTALW